MEFVLTRYLKLFHALTLSPNLRKSQTNYFGFGVRGGAVLGGSSTLRRSPVPENLVPPQRAAKIRPIATNSSLKKESQMSLRTIASQFVEMCNQGKNFDVMRTMYAPNIVSVEGDGTETAGQGPVIKKSEDWVSDKTFHGETVRGPFYNGANPDQFVVYFTLDITPKSTGKRITLEEVGVYTVKNDKITREQFFYDVDH